MFELTQDKQEIRIKNKFLAQVFGLMAIGLLISAVFAYTTSENAIMRAIIFSNPMSFMAIILVQFGLVYAISGAIEKISSSTATALFLGYSALTGVTLSSVFLIYTQGSIFYTFGITSLTFLAMSFMDIQQAQTLQKWEAILLWAYGVLLLPLFSIYSSEAQGLTF